MNAGVVYRVNNVVFEPRPRGPHHSSVLPPCLETQHRDFSLTQLTSSATIRLWFLCGGWWQKGGEREGGIWTFQMSPSLPASPSSSLLLLVRERRHVLKIHFKKSPSKFPALNKSRTPDQGGGPAQTPPPLPSLPNP